MGHHSSKSKGNGEEEWSTPSKAGEGSVRSDPSNSTPTSAFTFDLHDPRSPALNRTPLLHHPQSEGETPIARGTIDGLDPRSPRLGRTPVPRRTRALTFPEVTMPSAHLLLEEDAVTQVGEEEEEGNGARKVDTVETSGRHEEEETELVKEQVSGMKKRGKTMICSSSSSFSFTSSSSGSTKKKRNVSRKEDYRRHGRLSGTPSKSMTPASHTASPLSPVRFALGDISNM
eukprot:TRINITY_DN30161_c0_g1_i1.p1 TRINITY_DN30161_c0_g1~~TRINITY_DN30161_c0_g1_i1.p1  ORF type:complete len:230 (-),score=67.83 TRINITY_DN30161_c0_g1_i1:16-705(-)